MLLLNFAVFAISMALSYYTAKWVSQNGPQVLLVQTANDRSMHSGTIPTGGGIGIVAAGTLSGLLLAGFSDLRLLSIVLLALALGLLGLVDDIRALRRLTRLFWQGMIALGLTLTLAPIAPPFLPELLPSALILGFTVVGVVWWINLYNFMDGIDGLAASEGIFLLIAGAVVAAMVAPSWLGTSYFAWKIAVAAACLGFLFYNLPPARVFMGDTSSLYLPIVIAAMGLETVKAGLLTYPFWLILGACFIVDATATLLTRLITGQKWTDSHRTHAYQKLALRAGSHLTALLAYNAINIVWLLPLALAALRWQEIGWWLVMLAYLPLVAFALWMRAGRIENKV